MTFQAKVVMTDFGGAAREELRGMKSAVQRLARQYRGSDHRTVESAWKRLVGGEPVPEIVAAVASGEEFTVRLRS